MTKPWTVQDIPPQTGKRIIITGANSGIGWHTALELARAGAEVTISARSQEKVEGAAARIRAQVPQAHIKMGVMDLANFASVRAFAEREVADPRPVDVLVNNAGIMALPRREVSKDGFEMQFATNVLGPFLLTGLLMQRILSASAPRVVNVSSYAHTIGGPVPVEDLNSELGYKPVRAYAKTKLENILLTRELQRRAGDRLVVTTCHPGASHTNLAVNTTLGMKLTTWLLTPIMQNAAGGAEPTLMAATWPEAKPGGYYGPGGLWGLRGHPVETRTALFADDREAGHRLFSELEQMTGISYGL
jgi:NAD(P)-dependent dehydrogenase (short-subunit alcohol dehydrogenase family)